MRFHLIRFQNLILNEPAGHLARIVLVRIIKSAPSVSQTSLDPHRYPDHQGLG